MCTSSSSAKRLSRQGIEVDIFTRATDSSLPPVVEAYDGVVVRHITAGPYEGLTKGELPGSWRASTRGLRAEAAQPLGHYDVVHSHYWLSGQVGALARDRWGVPLVHTMHTMAKVKNDALADGDIPEPVARIIGEQQVVEASDMLIASTDMEAKQLINLYDADPGRVEVVPPGSTCRCSGRWQGGGAVRARPPGDAQVLLFAGRIQPLKAPDVLLQAVAVLLDESPGAAVAAGGPDRRRPLRHRPRASGVARRAGHRAWARRRGPASCRRWRRPSWPGGTRPRLWSPYRPTTSRSAWSPSRRRRPAPRSSPPRWVG